MKVILSIEGVRYPLTGIGRYIWELARNLPAVHEIERLDLFRGATLLSDFPYPGAEPGFAGQMAKGLTSTIARFSLCREAYSFVQSRALASHGDAVFHGTNYYLPRFSGRSVVTIHDLSILKHPETHPPGRVSRLAGEIRKSVQRADMIITDSEFTRQEIIDYFALKTDGVRAVPLAASEEFYPRPASEIGSILERHGLQFGRYCLYAGTIEPRKNIGTMLDAYSMLPDRLKKQYPLVVVGYRGWSSDDTHEMLRAGAARGEVFYLGYVDADTLPPLIAGARAFIYPSRYEGFGLPVLEAMASGVPVICSNAASLPEVAGDAAAICEPDDTAGFNRMIETALEDDAWHARMREKALARASQFSWQKTALKTAEVYAGHG